MINNLCSSCRANTSGCTFRRLFAGGLCCAQCDHDDHFANMPEAVSATNIRAQAGRTRRAAALLVHHAEDDEAFRAVLDDVAATEARLMIKAMVNLVEELSPAIFSERGLELLRRVIVERAHSSTAAGRCDARTSRAKYELSPWAWCTASLAASVS